jgi:hypothetical protein
MKGLSVWQPWASAMALELKKIETRVWKTSYRGDLVICSAQKKPLRADFETSKEYFEALELPYGLALCVVNLVDVIPTESINTPYGGPLPPKFIISEQEFVFGNYAPRRFAWITANCRRLKSPVPVRGRQMLFDLPSHTELDIIRQLNELSNQDPMGKLHV